MKTKYTFLIALSVALAALVLVGAGSAQKAEAAPTACVPGPHSGTITADETWCLADSPHLMSGNVTVAAGATLAIEPGVTVQGSTNLELKVLGHLEAVGTPTQPIVFTRVNTNVEWTGLIFDGSAGQGAGHLRYVTVEYAANASTVGYNPFDILALNVVSDTLVIENSVLRNGARGLFVIQSRVAVSDTVFTGFGNGGYWPLQVEGANSVLTLHNNTFTGNANNQILLMPGALMSRNTTLRPQAVMDGYRLAGNFTVPAGITLTLAPGTQMLAGTNQELKVLGHLEAVGTPTQPITFTRAPNEPAWTGLVFDGSAGQGAGHLQYVTVEYGDHASSVGYNPFNILALNVLSDTLVIEDSLIRNPNRGLFVVESRVAVSDTVFTGFGNGDYWPLQVEGANSVLTLHNNTFTGNANNQILLMPGALMSRNTTLRPQAVMDGYRLADDFTVPLSVTLTLEPGATVLAGTNQELKVLGHLEAVGTPTQPITFTRAPNQPAWTGLVFDGSAGQGAGHLRYVTVEYGENASSVGYNPFNILALNVLSDTLVIEDSLIRNPYRGLFIVSSRVAVSNTMFTGFASGGYWPVQVQGGDSVMTLNNNTFTGNANNQILLIPGAMMGHHTTLLPQPGLQGYRLADDFTVPLSVTLTLEPGVTVLAGTNQELKVLGHLEAVGTPTQPITFTRAPNEPAWTGLVFDGSAGQGAGHLQYVTVEYGENASSVGYNPFNILALNLQSPLVIEDSLIRQGGRGLVALNSPVTVRNSVFIGNGGYGAYISSDSTVFTLTNSTVILNAGDGVYMAGGRLAARNTVFADNASNGVMVAPNGRATLLHPTIARNRTNGVYVDNGGAVTMTNSIIAENATGVRVIGSGQATLTNTLWDHNTTPTVGAVNETGHLEGLAHFAPDGYHITRYSAALEQGVNAGVTDDIDAQARPLPAGTFPDLGADEYPYALDTEFVAEKAAFAPQWIVDPANPYGRLQQRYLIRYYYGSADPNPPDLTVSVTDTLPAGLAFQSEWHFPAMAFQQQGQQLAWQTTSPVQHGQSGQMQIVTLYNNPQAGRILTNTAELRAGEFHFNLQAATQVPVVAPLIISLGNGEVCPGTVVISGTAQAGVTVTLYANGSPVAQAPAVNGIFTANYNYPGGDVTLRARACGANGLCSAESNAVSLTSSQSFWCPQRSTWEGTPTAGPLAGQHLVYQFRDNSGQFSTQNWVIPGVFGFWNTTLHLYACNCPPSSGTTNLPSNVWVVADGVRYDDPSPSPPWYNFAITGGAHSVRFYAQCGSTVVSSDGTVLIDPDGYVFDVTQGFDPISPTLHALSGITVTAYVSMTEWGGWVPWPAHLYNNQVNPQVTDDDGYFAFFTPPGYYYLQVEGPAGYQSWRSPVIQVVNEIVHVNVPLTPWTDGEVTQVTLNPTGPGPATLTVTEGATVEWRAPWDNMAPPAAQLALVENPTLRLLSARNPLSDTLGFDGGMLAPGQVYRRQFTQEGTYTYTDGQGHTATIVVTAARKTIYLPLVMRNR